MGWQEHRRTDVHYELEGLAEGESARIYPDRDGFSFFARVDDDLHPGSAGFQINGHGYPDKQTAAHAVEVALKHMRALVTLTRYESSREALGEVLDATRAVQNTSRRLLSEDEVSAEYGIGKKTLQNRRYRRVGPPFMKVGARVFYDRLQLEDWIEQQHGRASHEEGG